MLVDSNVKETDLKVAASLFPPVQCVCVVCGGEKSIRDPESRLNIPAKIPCPGCEGTGFFLREMEAREEHYYIMHLLQTRFQLR